ncbi:hypothetical protein B0H63DRAFT_523440 [Podospora didyma]|uniref:Uncharacterized protein n=1 Tax=Podospora didyma TaxID=330526 RepID=A0AAE0NR46_9PEZI|nr:hypothetical protein B0H63DRAFT_523440 [Podospora didyma]
MVCEPNPIKLKVGDTLALLLFDATRRGGLGIDHLNILVQGHTPPKSLSSPRETSSPVLAKSLGLDIPNVIHVINYGLRNVAAARGLGIPNVTHVINYDRPPRRPPPLRRLSTPSTPTKPGILLPRLP